MTEANRDSPIGSISALELRRPRHQALPFEPRRSNHTPSPPTTQSGEDYPHIYTFRACEIAHLARAADMREVSHDAGAGPVVGSPV
jgi:hypothetical protein